MPIPVRHSFLDQANAPIRKSLVSQAFASHDVLAASFIVDGDVCRASLPTGKALAFTASTPDDGLPSGHGLEESIAKGRDSAAFGLRYLLALVQPEQVTTEISVLGNASRSVPPSSDTQATPSLPFSLPLSILRAIDGAFRILAKVIWYLLLDAGVTLLVLLKLMAQTLLLAALLRSFGIKLGSSWRCEFARRDWFKGKRLGVWVEPMSLDESEAHRSSLDRYASEIEKGRPCFY